MFCGSFWILATQIDWLCSAAVVLLCTSLMTKDINGTFVHFLLHSFLVEGLPNASVHISFRVLPAVAFCLKQVLSL